MSSESFAKDIIIYAAMNIVSKAINRAHDFDSNIFKCGVERKNKYSISGSRIAGIKSGMPKLPDRVFRNEPIAISITRKNRGAVLSGFIKGTLLQNLAFQISWIRWHHGRWRQRSK